MDAMDLQLQPTAVRRAWAGGDGAADELARAAGHAAGAGDRAGALAGIASCVADAARDLEGALRVARAVLEEHGAGLAECLADFAATDGASAGRFHGLSPGPGP